MPVENKKLKTDIQTFIENLPDGYKEACRQAIDITKTRLLPPVKSVPQCVKKFLDLIQTCISDDPQISLLGVDGLNYILTVSTRPTNISLRSERAISQHRGLA